MAAPLVGVLALQGAFREHAAMLRSLGAETREIRQRRHLEGLDAIVLPGGESSTMGRLLAELDMLEDLRGRIAGGLPAYGSCAGMILLCRDVEDSAWPRLGGLHARARRNAFGSQVDSFEEDLAVAGLDSPMRAVFIRAPLIVSADADVEILARTANAPAGGGDIVAVRQGRMLATAFHPELTDDTRMHGMLLAMIRE